MSDELVHENTKDLEIEDNCGDISASVSEQIDANPAVVESLVEPNLKNLSTTKNDPAQETTTETLSDDLQSAPCSITVQFHDDVVADMYKCKFLKFISSFSEFRVCNDNDICIRIYRDTSSTNKPEETSIPSSPKKRKKHSKVKKELFVVDVTPFNDTVETDVRYTTKFTISTDKQNDENIIQRMKSSCFNCGEPHALKDCPHPKDFVKINAARQKFKSQTKSSRYHLEQEQKYGHLQPGKISNELRRALGLGKNEVPHYIYSMRKLGYPPGWLEEAKFVHSNLDMFDIDGNNVKGATLKNRGLDEKKIVDYPGFNVSFPKGVKDEYRTFRVPPYSENFSKNAMMCFFNKLFVPQDNLESCDMEIDNDPDYSNLCQERITEIKASVDRNSPSLIDLELQKQQLLEELNDEPKDEIKDSDLDSDKGFSTIKASCFGTPLLKSSSPYSTVPNPDNFSKDVSPVINFENLPNSTGKYEQLTDVLQKVRSTLKKIENCNS